jgi:hypothetical protein
MSACQCCNLLNQVVLYLSIDELQVLVRICLMDYCSYTKGYEHILTVTVIAAFTRKEGICLCQSREKQMQGFCQCYSNVE